MTKKMVPQSKDFRSRKPDRTDGDHADSLVRLLDDRPPPSASKGFYEDLPEGTLQLTEKQSRLTDAEVLKKFQAPEEEVYRYGRGDEITIEVWDHPELSGKHVIGPDGFISLPIVGAIKDGRVESSRWWKISR